MQLTLENYRLKQALDYLKQLREDRELHSGIEIKEYYLGNFQTVFEAVHSNGDIIGRNTDKVTLIRAVAKLYGEDPRAAGNKQVKSSSFRG